MKTAAIAYGQKVGRSLEILVYAIPVVFTNVRELRVSLERRNYYHRVSMGYDRKLQGRVSALTRHSSLLCGGHRLGAIGSNLGEIDRLS